MRLLLDTHAFLWAILDPGRLSAPAKSTLSGSHEFFLSHISIWECVIKHSAGKLNLPGSPVTYLRAQAEANAVALLPVTLAHLRQLETLPPLHRDPFDRLLVSQAQADDLALVSANANLARYTVRVIW